MLTVKLTETRLTGPQDDGLEPRREPGCWGSASPILLNLTVPSGVSRLQRDSARRLDAERDARL